MPVVNSPMGRFRFPDDMAMEDIDAEMSALHAPEPPQGNNFAGALRSAFFPEQQQAPSVLPVISAPGLSPQNGDRLRGIVGRQQQLDASELLRQRATREKAIEAEKERAVRAVRQLRKELGTAHGTVKRVATQLGIGTESLRAWVKQADIDAGAKPGMTSVEAARIKELEQENRELKRTNEILRKASAYFAQAELDRR